MSVEEVPCECILEGDFSDDAVPCNQPGPNGTLCSRPQGHDGSHTACNVAEHPTEVWE